MTTQLNQLIADVAELETSELETFVGQVSLLLARRKTASLPLPEIELLQVINRSLPVETEARYSNLQDKVQAETITSTEYGELVKLIDITEQADADRLEALITLSQIRQVPLSDLMQQLGIYPPSIGG